VPALPLTVVKPPGLRLRRITRFRMGPPPASLPNWAPGLLMTSIDSISSAAWPAGRAAVIALQHGRWLAVDHDLHIAAAAQRDAPFGSTFTDGTLLRASAAVPLLETSDLTS
jgi:hypothetical protein